MSVRLRNKMWLRVPLQLLKFKLIRMIVLSFESWVASEEIPQEEKETVENTKNTCERRERVFKRS